MFESKRKELVKIREEIVELIENNCEYVREAEEDSDRETQGDEDNCSTSSLAAADRASEVMYTSNQSTPTSLRYPKRLSSDINVSHSESTNM